MSFSAGSEQVPKQLILAECFGPTLQGEGPSAGRSAVFVRTSRCNLSCAWCDTPYTWDWTRFDPRTSAERRSVADVVDWVAQAGVPLVVITGGEPLLQQDTLTGLVERLLVAGYEVEVETNGTIVPSPELCGGGARFNVSPKLANSQLPESKRISPAALRAFVASQRATFKFVATGVSDLTEIEELSSRFNLAPVWVMPEGVTEQAVLDGTRALAQAVAERGWALSTRLHVLIWGDERGR